MNSFYKILFIMTSLSASLFSNEIDKSVKVLENTNKELQTYQKSIDKNEDSRQELLNEYKYVNSNLKSTKRYNTQLEKIITSQEEELKSFEQQIVDIEQTQKNIFPLMLDMISSLKKLIEQDTPFLLKERQDRVNRLEKTLNRADIQTHEKYRIILEAFKIEYDYAKTIEFYQDKINNKTYNFFRLGRVSLYFQSLDLKEYGFYNKSTNTWNKITDSKSKSNIRKAIKIAKKQQNVDFLNLPFLAKKESK